MDHIIKLKCFEGTDNTNKVDRSLSWLKLMEISLAESIWLPIYDWHATYTCNIRITWKKKQTNKKNYVQLLWMDELARKTQNTTGVFYTRVQMFISALKLTMLNM